MIDSCTLQGGHITTGQPPSQPRLTYDHQVQSCLLTAYGVAEVAGVGATVQLLSIPYLQFSEVSREQGALFRVKETSILLLGYGSLHHTDQLDG